MSATSIVIVVAVAAAVGILVGWTLGERRGRDIQRVDDICELWRRMPNRDSRGRFARKEKHAAAV
jgi:hypothetical protein